MTDALRPKPAKNLCVIANRAQDYCGRFAPSPSGPLHFGSLVCALASYLHAKQHNGTWLLRIEDTDTPRTNENSVRLILDALSAHGLHWDGKLVFQSQRTELYTAYLKKLKQANYLYACSCTRRQIRSRNQGVSYDGYCRNRNLPFAGNSLRFTQTKNNSQFTDLFWGKQRVNHTMALEDPVLKRADGIFCYHLAVVVDDIEQQVTHVVRGSDLIDTTPVHLSLYQALAKPAPHYMHIPMLVKRTHEKLSKQRGSPAVDNAKALENLKLALLYLGVENKRTAHFISIEQLLYWATINWQPKLMPKQTELLISMENGVYSASKSMQ